MARDPKEFKSEEGRPYLVDVKEVTATKIKQAGRRVLDVVKWE
jgi:hypothetical protein